jgi:hypothetical protein
MFPKVYKEKGLDIFEDKPYIFKTTFSPAKDQYGDSYIIDDLIEGTQFIPTYITITNPAGYNSKDKAKIPVLPHGKIPVEYSGTDLDADRSERIGYLDIFDVSYLKSLPEHLRVTVNVF